MNPNEQNGPAADQAHEWRELEPDEIPVAGDEGKPPGFSAWEQITAPSMWLAGGRRIKGDQTRFRTRRPKPSDPFEPEPFRVKLFQLWRIPFTGSTEWGGLWETVGATDIGTTAERWQLRRVMVDGPRQELDMREDLPAVALLDHCECVTIQTLHKRPKK